jgi:hypothetical protein
MEEQLSNIHSLCESQPDSACVAPSSGALSREEGYSNCPSNRTTGIPPAELISSVDSLIQKNQTQPKNPSLIREWEALLEDVAAAGELLLMALESGVSPKETSVMDFKLSVSSAYAKLTSSSHMSDLLQMSPEESQSQVIGLVRHDGVEQGGIIQEVSDIVISHSRRNSDIEDEARELERILFAELDAFIDSIACERPSMMINRNQVAFLICTDIEDLDSIRKTNSVRWLNDVLKWQVLDMKHQLKRGRDSDELKRILDERKQVIKDIINRKLSDSTNMMKLQVKCDELEKAAECLEKHASTSAPTASSTPPVVPVKMTQSAYANDMDTLESAGSESHALK